MNRVYTYFGILSVLALAACGDAGADARESAAPGSPAAAEEDAGTYSAAAAPAAPTPTAVGVAPLGSGAGDLAASGSTASPPAGSAGQRPSPTDPRSAPADETPADAAAVLARAERAYDGIRSLEADFVQAVTIPLLESTLHSRGKLYIRRPDRFLMQFSQPAGDIVVADGRFFWMYYPSADPKQVMRTSVGDGSRQVDLQKEFLSNPTERYHAVLDGAESVDGRPATIVALTPKGPSGYRRVRIWVDRGDSLVRRFEITEENESLRVLDLRGLRPNVALDDGLFVFTPPPGTQVFTQ